MVTGGGDASKRGGRKAVAKKAVAKKAPPLKSDAQKPSAVDYEGPSRWETASAEVRKTVQWTATALAAAGGVVFGAGPVIARTELDASSWPIGRITLTIAAAVAGALGLVLVIASLVSAQLPAEVTLANLPRSFKKKVEADPSAYLPGDCTNIDEFRRRLRALQAAVAELKSKVAREDDQGKKNLLKNALATTNENADLYRKRRNEVLAQAGFEVASARVRSKSKPIVFGTALAVAGAVLYLLLISGKAATDSAKAGSTPPTQVGVLVKHDNGTSDQLWNRLQLAKCELSSGANEVPVLKRGGKGTDSDPYQVETLGRPKDCPALAFSVTDGVAKFAGPKPTDVKITYEPRKGSKP